MYILKTDVFLARFVRANRGDFANQAGVVAGLRLSSRVGKVYVSSFYPEHFKGLDDAVADFMIEEEEKTNHDENNRIPQREGNATMYFHVNRPLDLNA